MKWKGRRQSTNIEDRRNDPPDEIAETIAAYDNYTGGKSPESHTPKRTSKITQDEIKVAKELGRLNREKKTPIPTPKPLNITKTQVTPGEWKTKSK